jgi:hypothetical protein
MTALPVSSPTQTAGLVRAERGGGISRTVLVGAGFVVTLTLAWGFLYGRYGHGGDDGGFILGLSWRLLHGQLPYRDFIYIRPPLSPLLHALPLGVLPATGVVLAERFLFYATVATYSWIAAGLLTARGGELSRPLLALTGFVVSVLWFPPMPWHTVDGILLSVVGVACLARCVERGGGLGAVTLGAAGGLLTVAAALTKQPYAVVAPAALCWTGIAGGRRALLPALAGAVGGGLAALGAAAGLGILADGWSQIVGQTSLASLYNAGVVRYARGTVSTVAPPLAVWLLARLAGRWSGRQVRSSLLPWLVVVWAFGACIVGVATEEHFQPAAVNFPAGLWVVGAVALLADLQRRAAVAGLAGVLLVIAWSASISWGWQTPALFVTPVLYAAAAAARRHTGARVGRLAWTVLALGLVLQSVGYRHPYADRPRGELTRDLGRAAPRLAGIRSVPATERRLAELRAFAARYGTPSFTVLPGLPHAHLVTGAVPPPGVDWARNPETAGRGAALARELAAAGAVAFVERDARLCLDGAACSALTVEVVESWTFVARGDYFDVYSPPVAGSTPDDRPPVEPDPGDSS